MDEKEGEVEVAVGVALVGVAMLPDGQVVRCPVTGIELAVPERFGTALELVEVRQMKDGALRLMIVPRPLVADENLVASEVH